MRIVSWQSVLTDHQSHTLRALQEIPGVELVIVSGSKMLPARQNQGWKQPELTGLDVRYLSSGKWWREGTEILRRYDDAVHLFNGMWTDRRFLFLLLYAQRYGFDTCLITEPYADKAVALLSETHRFVVRMKAVLRPLIYRLAGPRLAKRMRVIFAISEKAVEQFTQMGVPRERIFPFGYFVPFVDGSPAERDNCATAPRVLFVGSLLERKGIYVLRDALDLMPPQKSILMDVYGPGDARTIEGNPSIRYRGVIPFGEAQKIISEYDLLVLPSLFDGWGVVVNEALLQGVPVIVSDQVGAKVLVESTGAGAIVPAGDAKALAKNLEALLDSPALLARWKKNAKNIGESIFPVVAASYMYEALTGDDAARAKSMAFTPMHH